MGLLYTVFIGIPLCVVLVAVGLLFCITVIGLPIGLTLIALGFKYLTCDGDGSSDPPLATWRLWPASARPQDRRLSAP